MALNILTFLFQSRSTSQGKWKDVSEEKKKGKNLETRKMFIVELFYCSMSL